MEQEEVDKSTEIWMDEIESKLSYKKWYFGHTHIPANIDERHTCVFLDLVKIEE